MAAPSSYGARTPRPIFSPGPRENVPNTRAMYVVCERHFFLVGRAGGECHPVVLQDARFTVFNKSICLLVLFGQLAKQ